MERGHIIVLPGGGYQLLAEHEGEPVVEWLGTLGFSASTFQYPVGVRHPAVCNAIRAEVRRVRREGARRVGLIGFSAGGHAAGHTAVGPGASVEETVDLVILGYPVVSMLLGTRGGSRRSLLGHNPSRSLCAKTSVDRLVTPDSPPFFIWHTSDDEIVPVQHSYALGSALARVEVAHELHVFPHGRHGLGLAQSEHGADRWPSLCADWLDALEWPTSMARGPERWGTPVDSDRGQSGSGHID